MPTHIQRKRSGLEEQAAQELEMYVQAIKNAQEGVRSAEALMREASRRARRAGKDDANVRLTGLTFDLETVLGKVKEL